MKKNFKNLRSTKIDELSSKMKRQGRIVRIGKRNVFTAGAFVRHRWLKPSVYTTAGYSFKDHVILREMNIPVYDAVRMTIRDLTNLIIERYRNHS